MLFNHVTNSSFFMLDDESGENRSKTRRSDRFSYDTSDDGSNSPTSEDEDVDECPKRNVKPPSQKELEVYDENQKSPSAVDYSDILEFIEEEEEPNSTNGNIHSEPVNTTVVDREIMPPPLPPPSSKVVASAVSPSDKKLETPLASMLPSKYAGVSVSF